MDLVAHLKSKVDVGSVSSVSPYRSVLESLPSLDREVAKGGLHEVHDADWGFMRSTLVAMGFGPSSIS